MKVTIYPLERTVDLMFDGDGVNLSDGRKPGVPNGLRMGSAEAIDQDIANQDTNTDLQQGIGDLNKNLSLYNRKNRYDRIVDDCMAARGYDAQNPNAKPVQVEQGGSAATSPATAPAPAPELTPAPSSGSVTSPMRATRSRTRSTSRAEPSTSRSTSR